MVDKSFEHTIRFHQITQAGETYWIPLVTVFLVQPNGNRVQLPLLFDTGASVTTLRHDLYHLLGLSAWDEGRPVQTDTAGGVVTAYEYAARLEFLGKTIECPVQLMTLRPNPLYLGLFGRARIFDEFGFGFWEDNHELYVTETP